MLSVALTGNIASGKSEVARMLADLGATVIDSDELSREVVRPGTPALAAIVSRWGNGVLNPDGTLNRAAMRALIFASDADRAALNAIVHPEIRRRRDELLAEARARHDAVVVAVIPLLFEAALEREYDRVILVDAPEELRLQRMVRARGIGAVDASRMMAAQMPATQKRRHADFVIDNDADLDALRRSVERVWRDITASLTL